MKPLMRLATGLLIGGAAALVARRFFSEGFQDKVVVITGGSRGLGLALAREFARHGACVELLARDEEELARAASSLSEFPVQVGTWTCDVTDAAAVKLTMSGIARARGRIDVLVNNAGSIVVAPLENLREADFEESIQIHLRAPLHATLSALPHLKKSHGRIVNIASIGGRMAVPHLASYSVGKFALVGLSDALRAELSKDGIRVTTVCPGLMRTGSHYNAKFLGDTRKEFAWFSLGATLPVISISAERAARQIVAAVREGRPELTISLQARLAVVAQALAPNLFARFISTVNQLLPRAVSGKQVLREGRDCTSGLSRSFLTRLGDHAAHRLNESPPPFAKPRLKQLARGEVTSADIENVERMIERGRQMGF